MPIEKRGVFFASIFILILFVASGALAATGSSGFDVDNVLLKLSLHQGESSDKLITLTATEDSIFTLEVKGLQSVSLADTRFSLRKGESKNIAAHFDASALKPGIYIGSITITDQKEVNTLPVIFEVETPETLFDVNLDIPPQYKDIAVNEKLIAQVKVFDLTAGGTSKGQGPTRVDLQYTIYSLGGAIISSQSEDAVVSVQTQLTKTFSFPSDLHEGDYILVARVTTPTSFGISSSLFTIHAAASKSFFGSTSLDSGLLYFLIAILIFFLVFISLFIYFVRDRDKLVLELRNYHADEMQKMQRFLTAQQKVLEERGSQMPDVHREVRAKLQALKETHVAREHELKKLQQRGDVRAMERKLSEWKHAGYNTRLLEYKLKGLSTEDMKRLLSEWKRQYGEGYKNAR